MRRSFRQGPTGLNGSTNLGLQAAEKWTVALPDRYAGGGKLVLIAGATDGWSFNTPFDIAEQQKLCDQGYVVIAADFGTPANWSNDTQLTRVTDMITAASTDPVIAANTTKVSWIGKSRGAMLALNWAWRHTSQVGAIVGQSPAPALALIHDRNPFGTTLAEIEAAYGGNAPYLAALPTHDPSAAGNMTSVAAFKTRVRLYYSTDDPVVIPSDITSYVTGTGVSLRPLGAVGHTFPPTSVHTAAQTQFIKSVTG